jgi:hypothetical protein
MTTLLRIALCAALLAVPAAHAQQKSPPDAAPIPALPKTPEQVAAEKAAEAWAAQALADEEHAAAERERKNKERIARESAAAARAEAEKAAQAATPTNYVERRDAQVQGQALAQPAPFAVTATGALWRSALVPGLGQIQTGRPYRGYAFMGAAAASLTAALILTGRAAQANNIYESAPLTVRDQAYDQARSYANSRNALFATTAAVWALSALEAYALYGTRDPGR